MRRATGMRINPFNMLDSGLILFSFRSILQWVDGTPFVFEESGLIGIYSNAGANCFVLDTQNGAGLFYVFESDIGCSNLRRYICRLNCS